MGVGSRVRSGGANGRINFAMLLQPNQVVALGAFLHFPKELHRFGFVAWFVWIVRRDDHFDIDGDDVPLGLNEPGPFNPRTCDPHD